MRLRYWGNLWPGAINPVAPNKPRLNICRADDHQGLGALAPPVVAFAVGAQEAAKTPRLHVVVEEPIEVSSSMDDALVDEFRRWATGASAMRTWAAAHIPEYSHEQKQVRAGGRGWPSGL